MKADTSMRVRVFSAGETMSVLPSTRQAESRVQEAVWVRSSSVYARYGKPTIDRVCALLLLVLVLPVMLVVALVVRVKLGSGVLYRQQRVGRNGQTFTILKFRTMLPDRRKGAPAGGYYGPERRVTHKSGNDPRHTPLGRRLRRWSLDELPQLWNVLRGDMSLVGPRPELLDIVAAYEPWQHERHQVSPGLTGMWQVVKRGQDSGKMEQEDTLLDLDYVESVSFLVDTRIILMTIPAVLFHRGR